MHLILSIVWVGLFFHIVSCNRPLYIHICTSCCCYFLATFLVYTFLPLCVFLMCERWRFRFRKEVLEFKNAFCRNMSAPMPVWMTLALRGSDPFGSWKWEWFLLPWGLWQAVWAWGESVIELCHGLLLHSPYVSNFTVVSFISFSIWGKAVSWRNVDKGSQYWEQE